MQNKKESGRKRAVRISTLALGFTLFQLPQIHATELYSHQGLVNDSTVVCGKLENGLTYYIKNNKDNTQQITYSLILKAGSLDEDQSQKGLAHFNEHLSFQGTPTFKTGVLDGSFISGIDKKKFYTNALTSQTETIYTLMLPDARESISDTAVILLKEWLCADFNNEEAIKKESQIIAKEWLNFQDVSERGRRKWYPLFYNDSKWAFSQSIGELDIINKADVNEIVRYRNEWYRPELAAITIVGDVDPAQMLSKIRKQFNDYPDNKVKREKQQVLIPDRESRRSVTYTDKDQQFSFFSIYHRRQNPDLYTEEGIKLSLKYSLMNAMMAGRMFDIQEANSGIVSYLGANSYYLMKPDWIYSPNASVVNGKMREALKLVAREQERIAQHGFLTSEFEKARDVMKKRYAQTAQSGLSKSNNDWTKAFENNFLLNTPYCLSSDEAKAYLPVLEKITLKDMEAFHAELWADQNSTVVIAVPESDFATAPQESEVLQILADVKKEQLEPYKELDFSTPLFDTSLFTGSGKIKKHKSLSSLPVWKYTLSNGAEIVYYNDTTKHGQILFEAVSRGGKSLLSPSQSAVADLACELFNEGPVGNYSLNHFRRYLGDESMQMNISVSSETEGIRGSVTTGAFEQLMQRMFMLFNHTELQADKYQSLLDGKKDRYFALNGTNESQFAAYIAAKLSGQATEEAQADVSLSELEQILKARFASPSDFTFYFTGAMQDVAFEELISKYLGSGKKMKREHYTDRYLTQLKGDSQFIFKKGTDERAVVRQVIGSPYHMNMNNMSLLQAANPLISQRLNQRIREELHLVYDIRSELKLRSTPVARADFEVSFNCNPDDVSRITKEVRAIFAKFAEEGPSESELGNIKNQMLGSKKYFESDNSFRLGCIRSHDQNLNNDYEQQVNNLTFIESMTSVQVKQLLSQILDNKAGVSTVFSLQAE